MADADTSAVQEPATKVLKTDKLRLVAESLIQLWTKGGEPAEAVERLKVAVDSLDRALQVHQELVHPTLASQVGGLAGWKLGWKRAFEPERQALYGPLFHRGLLRGGEHVSLKKHHIFCAEAEFGFVFAKQLEPRQEPYSEGDVWDAVDHVELCIELCGARQTMSENRLHYVADALLGSGVVRGLSLGKPDPAGLTNVLVKLSVAGVELASGTGKENPCDAPLASITYCINDLCVKRGVQLEAGSLVIAGHTCQVAFKDRPVPPHVQGKLPEAHWRPGDTLRAEFENLGSVEAILEE